MPTKVLSMFQPAPCAGPPSCETPQIAPAGHRFESAPSTEGPWITVPTQVQKHPSTVDCEILSVNADGTPKYPGLDFTKGDCYGLTVQYADTDTHLRAKAYAIVDRVEVTAVSNVWPLPETNVGLSFWLLVFAIMAFVGTDRPTRRS